MFPFHSCSTISISGTTGSGKTTFVKKLIENLDTMFEPISPKKVLYCYGVYQDEFTVMENSFPSVSFQRGLPSESDIEELIGNHNVIVMDDLMNELVNNKEMEKLFTQGAHHKKLTILYLNQNMYCQGKHSRTINLNTHYMILLKNPRDVSQIQCLGKQVFPGKSRALIEAYNDCMKKPFGYLVLDLSPHGEEDYRIRTGVFPDEICVIYKPL